MILNGFGLKATQETRVLHQMFNKTAPLLDYGLDYSFPFSPFQLASFHPRESKYLFVHGAAFWCKRLTIGTKHAIEIVHSQSGHVSRAIFAIFPLDGDLRVSSPLDGDGADGVVSKNAGVRYWLLSDRSASSKWTRPKYQEFNVNTTPWASTVQENIRTL